MERVGGEARLAYESDQCHRNERGVRLRIKGRRRTVCLAGGLLYWDAANAGGRTERSEAVQPGTRAPDHGNRPTEGGLRTIGGGGVKTTGNTHVNVVHVCECGLVGHCYSVL